jgi:hypothetical protein
MEFQKKVKELIDDLGLHIYDVSENSFTVAGLKSEITYLVI